MQLTMQAGSQLYNVCNQPSWFLYITCIIITCCFCRKQEVSYSHCMDAVFGLPRKKSAGQSFREPIHGHLFFGDQTLVDEFVLAKSLLHIKKSKVLHVCDG